MMKISNWSLSVIIGWLCVLFPGVAWCQASADGNDPAIVERNKFLQANFSRFQPVEFIKPTNGVAVFQDLHVQKNMFSYGGSNYCGFQFTVPEWIDGDFAWEFLLDKAETNKDFANKKFEWYIIPQTGSAPGFQYFMPLELAGYPRIQRQFPFTKHMFSQVLDRNRLVPGKTYGIWFGFEETNTPDIAFAMTIDSQRGEGEFGILPEFARQAP